MTAASPPPRRRRPRTGGALALPTGGAPCAFDGLTYWARANRATTLNVAGIGNDAVDSTLNTEITNLPLTTSWTQFTIPIPDPPVLTGSTGLFHFAEGSDEGRYTIWMDEIRYVDLPAGRYATGGPRSPWARKP